MRTSNLTLFLFVTLLGTVSLTSCRADNPLYCGDSSACKMPTAPVCDTKIKACRGCGNNEECMALDPSAPACVGGQCVACGVNADCKVAAASFCEASTNLCRGCGSGDECAAMSADKPVCLATGLCAGCDKDADCKSADKPVCDATTKSCRGCTANTDCSSGVCGPSGACVGCVADADCKGADKAVCDTTASTCRGCSANAECVALDPAKPVCTPTGVCMECNASADCKDPTKPVCNTATHTCRGCQEDTECPSDPGVCMAHAGGRCAAPSETIYVVDAGPGTCSDMTPATVVGGTKDLPVCSLQAGIALVTAQRPLVVVRGTVYAGDQTVFSGSNTMTTSVVGQKAATLGKAGTVVTVSAGSFYLRGLTVDSGFGAGIAANGGTLRLDGVTVTGCPLGGIILDGAAFDIRNTVVTNNGDPNGSGQGSGIDVRQVPATGPKSFTNVTSRDNYPSNLSCNAVVMGTGVLAPGVIPSDCGIASCGTPGPTCGAP